MKVQLGVLGLLLALVATALFSALPMAKAAGGLHYQQGVSLQSSAGRT